MKCIHCGKETADYPFHVLQVQTLHVRDLGGEKRVQALGDFEDYAVCADCAKAEFRAATDTGSTMVKRGALYAAMIVAGIVLAVIFLKDNGALRLLGFGLILCGILSLYSTIRSINAQRQQLMSMDRKAALADCAWKCFLQSAPKKHNENDITYIPVNEETLSRKNGDLMVLYKLLPEIAIEAHKRIHNITE